MDRPLVLVNAVVRTLDARGTTASAVAARDGRIVYVGDGSGARRGREGYGRGDARGPRPRRGVRAAGAR